MKKALSLLITATLVTLPGYQCVANNGFSIPDSRSMGVVAKAAALGAMAGLTVVGVKAFNWYQHRNAVAAINPSQKHNSISKHTIILSEPSDTIIWAQWKLSDYPTIFDLRQKKDAVIAALRQEATSNKVSLKDVKENIQSELDEVSAIIQPLLPYVTYDTTIILRLDMLTADALAKYYASFEPIKYETVKAPEAPGSFEFSQAYASKAAWYVLGKAKQLATWVTQKPTIDAGIRDKFIEALKRQHRLEVLSAIVDEVIQAEVTVSAPKQKETPVVVTVAPVVQEEAPKKRAGLFDNLYQQIKSNPALAAIATVGTLSATLFACDALFNN